MKEREISLELVPGGWQGTPRAAQKTGTWRTLRPIVDNEECIGCSLCETFCPENTIKVKERKAIVDYDYCKGCGICANECLSKAISMELEVKSKSNGGEC